ncbi:YfbM family protein [Actinoplanes sp. NPDC048796]|uniref:YfbM family protein n=1 Tax=unclassified Actinoplanes TaxID=2626549 RepID=UPI003409D76B
MIFVGRRLPNDEVEAVLDDPEAIDALLYGDGPGQIDLDKSWHALHFLLTGTTWDITEGAGSALLGGTVVGDDNGYGPPRLLRPAEVRAVADALTPITPDILRARWNPKALSEAEIYPDAWDPTDFGHYLEPNFTTLRDFYRAAAAENQAVLIAIT